jgi:hypothetical protein
MKSRRQKSEPGSGKVIVEVPGSGLSREVDYETAAKMVAVFTLFGDLIAGRAS